MTASATPIEDYLDELLRRLHADPRTVRRVMDEAADHLWATAAELEATGMSREAAEREAVRRFGAVREVTTAYWLRSFRALVVETLRAAVLLGATGLVAIGLSGAVAAVMNAVAGLGFVGGATVFATGGSTVAETAHDAVVLRLLAGAVGVVLLAGYAVVARRLPRPQVLPAGLADALGAAAFAAATVVLVAASVDQAATGVAGRGVGFFLSGAIVSAVGMVAFCARAARALLTTRRLIDPASSMI